MKKKNIKKITHLIHKISEDSIRINYLLQSAIYKTDEERETFILSELAIKLSENIYKNSNKISHYVEFS